MESETLKFLNAFKQVFKRSGFWIQGAILIVLMAPMILMKPILWLEMWGYMQEQALEGTRNYDRKSKGY